MHSEKKTRRRSSPLFPIGSKIRWGYQGYVAPLRDITTKGFYQRTESRDTNFRTMQRIGNDPRLPIQTRRFAKSRDEGSPFFTERISVKNSHMDPIRVVSLLGFKGHYLGPCMATNTDNYWPSLMSSTDRTIEQLELFGLGGTAIKRTMPLSPDLDLTVTFGELLKDGVPSMIGSQLLRRQTLSRKDYLKRSSGEFLNIQFGILPLARDISALANAARRSAMQIKQMYRDSQRTIRRRYDFPVQETVTETVLGTANQPYVWAGNYPDTFLNTGTLVRRRTERRETWFSGRYRYYLPKGDGLADKAERWLAEADRLNGVKITPETLWNLYPWTWLSDWFLTLGNVVSNVSRMGSDRIALQYGYIMRRTLIKDEFILTGCRAGGPVVGKPISDIRTTITYERKVRYPASPYGFGLSTAEFTPQQWAILGALGITRAPGRF